MGDMMSQAICQKFESAFKLLGKRWNGLIIHQLMEGPKRFNELESEIKLSGKILSERLKELETHDIVKRNVYPETPVRIEYVLTPKGYAMKPFMEQVTKWSNDWIK